MRRLCLLSLAVFMMFSLSACSGNSKKREDSTSTSNVSSESATKDTEENNKKETEKYTEKETEEKTTVPQEVLDAVDNGIYILKSEDSVSLQEPMDTLDPKEVYKNVEYIPEMFYGEYLMENERTEFENYEKNVGTIDIEIGGFSKAITAIPYRVYAGKHNINYYEAEIPGYNWANLFFRYMNSDGSYSYFDVRAAYTVSGNTVTFKLIDEFDYDKETNKVTYSFCSTSLTYEFEFCGPYLTLSQDGKSVTMKAYDFTYYVQYNNNLGMNIILDNYVADNSPRIEGIERIKLQYLSGENAYREALESEFIVFIDDGQPEAYIDATAIGTISEDGLLTFTFTDRNGTMYTRQYVYFYGSNNGLVLTDGKNTYLYTFSYLDTLGNNLSDNLTYEDISKLDDMSEAELEEIVEKKANLLTDLAKAYEDAGLNVEINEKTGEITLDSTVLFDVNESEVSNTGREFLKKFINIYTSVVYDEKYENFVSQIMVEGHTDTNGSYEMNLKLSQDRADSVKNFCLSTDSGISDGYKALLTESLTAKGYAYDNPIYDANGEVDMAASRRVSFRFIINLEG